MPSSKKSQAAMEFLLNYGWVILIVIIIIAALSYSGVLDPKALIPEKCVFKVGFDCLDYGVNRWDSGTGGSVNLKLLNSLAENVHITEMGFTSRDISLVCTDPSGTVLMPDKAEYILFICEGTFPEKDKVKLEISGKYHTGDAQFMKEIYGEVTSTVNTVEEPTGNMELVLNPEEQWAMPGPVTYELRIKNLGSTPDLYTIYYGEGPGSLAELKRVTVGAGQEITEQLNLDFSGIDPGQDVTTYVQIKSAATGVEVTKEATTHITDQPLYNFDISVDPMAKLVKEGGIAEYDVLIKSKGFGGTFSLSKADVQGTSLVEYRYNGDLLVNDELELPSGAERIVKMTVTQIDSLTKFNLKGKLQSTEKLVEGITTITVCNGFSIDISAARIDFFNGRIDFGGDIATKDNADYPDEVKPARYEVTFNGGTHTETIDDTSNAKFSVGKTGLVNSIEVVPVVDVEEAPFACDGKTASKTDIVNYDMENRIMKKVWRVWDDDGAATGATVEEEDVHTGTQALRYPRAGSADKPISFASGSVIMEDVDYFGFAVRGEQFDAVDKNGNPYTATTQYYHLFFQGYTFHAGVHGQCTLPGQYRGWATMQAGANWQLRAVDIDKPYMPGCVPYAVRPYASLNSLLVRVPYRSAIYLDSIYLYSVDRDTDEDGIYDFEDFDKDGDGHDSTYHDGDDCNDRDASRNPGAPETCPADGIDNDCDTIIDEDVDCDGDTYSTPDDCDDDDETINPGAEEECDDIIDNNCDGRINEGCPAIVDASFDSSGANWNGLIEGTILGGDNTAGGLYINSGSEGISFSGLPLTNEAGTIEMTIKTDWGKTTASPYSTDEKHHIFFDMFSGGSVMLRLTLNYAVGLRYFVTGSARLDSGGAGSWSEGQQVTIKVTWNKLADGNTMKMYVNGALIKQMRGGWSTADLSGLTLYFGRSYNGGQPLNGYIKDIKIYNYPKRYS